VRRHAAASRHTPTREIIRGFHQRRLFSCEHRDNLPIEADDAPWLGGSRAPDVFPLVQKYFPLVTHSCAWTIQTGDAMSFGLYSAGFVIVIGGLIYAAYLLHMPTHWIVVGAVVLVGLGILKGVKATRQKDPAG
jgi:hypothetical protein